MTSGDVTGDPFLGRLRRLQPDVDIVVLPPDETPPGTPALDPVTQRRHESAVTEVLDRLIAEAGLLGMARTATWRRTTGAAHRWVATATRDDLTPAASIAALRAVRDLLVDSPAWDARPGPGAGARLTARSARHPLTIEAHATPSSLVVSVAGDAVVPAPAGAAEDG